MAATEPTQGPAESREDPADTALRAALEQFHRDRREQSRIDASHFVTYATIYDAASAHTDRECSPTTSATERAERFAWNLRSVAGEFTVSKQLTDGALINRAHNAHTLFEKFPAWHAALAADEVQVGHVHVVLRCHTPVSDEHLERFGREVLTYAREHTVSSTESFAKQRAASLMRGEFEKAFTVEHEQRRITVQHTEHGMCHLTAYLSSAVGEAIHDLLTVQAKELIAQARAEATERRSEPGFEADRRTLDQQRADIFADTMLTATPQAILDGSNAGAARLRAVVSITTPVLALLDPRLRDPFHRMGGSDTAAGIAMLNGIQPMSAAEARAFAANGELERILTDPITGHVITADRYEPTTSLRRYLRARDVTCRFPGCRRPAVRCETDHTTAWHEGGSTCPGNLAHLCRVHHVQKHQKPWQVRHLGGGRLEWISPLGQVICTVPEPPGPRFVEVHDPPPF
ncbi:HNH endonuclease signature motif containing protein [Gulosibacter faecalis]|nr:HNH endonuclease signature motif containing protein [Gulosibacter faecalis]